MLPKTILARTAFVSIQVRSLASRDSKTVRRSRKDWEVSIQVRSLASRDPNNIKSIQKIPKGSFHSGDIPSE